MQCLVLLSCLLKSVLFGNATLKVSLVVSCNFGGAAFQTSPVELSTAGSLLFFILESIHYFRQSTLRPFTGLHFFPSLSLLASLVPIASQLDQTEPYKL